MLQTETGGGCTRLLSAARHAVRSERLRRRLSSLEISKTRPSASCTVEAEQRDAVDISCDGDDSRISDAITDTSTLMETLNTSVSIIECEQSQSTTILSP